MSLKVNFCSQCKEHLEREYAWSNNLPMSYAVTNEEKWLLMGMKKCMSEDSIWSKVLYPIYPTIPAFCLINCYRLCKKQHSSQAEYDWNESASLVIKRCCKWLWEKKSIMMETEKEEAVLIEEVRENDDKGRSQLPTSWTWELWNCLVCLVTKCW